MKPFNIKKAARNENLMINEKKLTDQRENMDMCVNAQGVDGKNINLSLPTKDKDNTVPFNVQLEASRKNLKNQQITEADMADNEISFNEEHDYVKPHDKLIQEFDDNKVKIYKTMEEKVAADTSFWDKFVGVEAEGDGMPTKVYKNIPSSASQLENNPERFKKEEPSKMVSAALKDADAMLFHIYATAHKEGRDLTEAENQQVVDIISGKQRILVGQNAMVEPMQRSSPSNPKIQEDGSVVEEDQKIDQFKSVEEAHQNYPEGELPFGEGIPF